MEHADCCFCQHRISADFVLSFSSPPPALAPTPELSSEESDYEQEYEAFIEAVDQLIKQPELREKMGKALHKHVETLCSDDEIYRTTMAAYDM